MPLRARASPSCFLRCCVDRRELFWTRESSKGGSKEPKNSFLFSFKEDPDYR